jgi:DNA-binding protein H-NS
MSENEFTSTLLRKNSLRKAVAEISVAELEKVLSDLQEIRDEKVAAEEERAAADATRQEAVKKIQAQMAELGLSADDLSACGAAATKKASVPAKYRLIDADGKPHEWSGRGRTPRVFLERFEKGAKKEDFLIQK